ncbi:MAG: cell division protein FtsL [Kangiellaceae bacterium]|jgi:cell division protein FtsL|nr:cell division protein FtsL [Kangiellaceae bacterium]
MKANLINILEVTLPLIVFNKLLEKKWLVLLGAIVWANAIMVAYYSHKVRYETALIEELKNEQYQLEMEWETLRLEQGALAEHNRIESIAKKRLNMRHVSRNSEVLITD